MNGNFLTYRKVVYSILDNAKLISKDKKIEEDHIIFEINNVRALLLKQKYSDIRKQVDEANLQQLSLEFVKTQTLANDVSTIKSKIECPKLLMLPSNPFYVASTLTTTALTQFVYTDSYSFVYTGYNRWLGNITYYTILSDNKIYCKSVNPQILHLNTLDIFGIFEDPIQVEHIKNPETASNLVDKLDYIFPLEAGLVAQLIEIVTKKLFNTMYIPEDKINNGNDELSEMQTDKK